MRTTIAPRCSYLTLLTLLMSGPARGQQIPIVPSRLAYGKSTWTGGTDALSKAFHSGGWDSLQHALKEALSKSVVRRVADDSVEGTQFFRFKDRYYLVVFLTNQRQLARVLIHTPSPEPYTNLLPGLSARDSLCEVFLTADTASALRSVYVFSRKVNPLTAQAPEFLSMLLGKLLPKVPLAPLPLRFVVNLVPVPFQRAQIDIKDEYTPSPQKDGRDPDQKMEKISATTQFINAPKTRAAFGVLSGLILASSGDPVVKLDKGLIVTDQLSRALSMGILNYQPWGYQAQSDRLTLAEIPRLFVGVVLTPKPGFALGLGLLPSRGIAINTGYAGLFVDGLRAGDTLGQAPSRPGSPFTVRVRSAWFAGLSFSFK